MASPEPAASDVFTFDRGYKRYEISNHLGNVLAVVGDRKIVVTSPSNDWLFDHYLADLWSVSDYHPFGMAVEERSWAAEEYRFGFNGKENDAEWDAQDYGGRIYMPKQARWISPDPIDHPYQSAYVAFDCNPIYFIDPNGTTVGDYYDLVTGKHKETDGINDNRVYVVDPDKINTSSGEGVTITSSEGETMHIPNEAITDLTQSTGITHDQFIQIGGFLNNEDQSSSARRGIAHAIVNRNGLNRNPANSWLSTLNSLGNNSPSQRYKKYANYRAYVGATPQERNENSTFYSITKYTIDALIGTDDPTNGATGWHGVDILPRLNTYKSLVRQRRTFLQMPKMSRRYVVCPGTPLINAFYWPAYKDMYLDQGFVWEDGATTTKTFSQKTFPNNIGSKSGKYQWTVKGAAGKTMFYR